ncbi:hypothetical protein GCM10022225_08710 [Plantactinospora mayteni]|uniref:DUF2510 domain-containing protein n=1 Tax=Plantactinospora mayteni TaxID=566021 RepID=A0ABQ4EJK8_9ACTN|nr:hypothetical protein [Plantactinospora mayteni]GIG94382.1 hypothetical protein Pma05_09550 [Plantactinospora mayteni]
MTDQPSGQRYSPDGRFWWDGTAWRPVEAVPPARAPGQLGPVQFPPPAGQPPVGPGRPPGTNQVGTNQVGTNQVGTNQVGAGRPPGAPAPPGSGPGLPGTTFPPPRGGVPGRPSKVGFLLGLVGTLVATALLGGLVGGVAGMVTTEPPGNESAPGFAAEFPTGDRQYMTGVTLAAVVEDWMKKSNSWVCSDTTSPETSGKSGKAMECLPADDDREMYVTIEYDADDKIKLVAGRCRVGLKSTPCTTLAASLADVVLSPQGDQLRKQAEKWATENADSERVTTIGGIRLEASLDPHGMTATPGV